MVARSARGVRGLRLSSEERKLITETRTGKTESNRRYASERLRSNLEHDIYPKTLKKFQLDWLERILKRHSKKLSRADQSSLVSAVLGGLPLSEVQIRKLGRPLIIELLSSDGDKKIRLQRQQDESRWEADREESERIARGGHPRGCDCRDCDQTR